MMVTSVSAGPLDEFKDTCEEMGFVPKTDKFIDCVLELRARSKQESSAQREQYDREQAERIRQEEREDREFEESVRQNEREFEEWHEKKERMEAESRSLDRKLMQVQELQRRQIEAEERAESSRGWMALGALLRAWSGVDNPIYNTTPSFNDSFFSGGGQTSCYEQGGQFFCSGSGGLQTSCNSQGGQLFCSGSDGSQFNCYEQGGQYFCN